MKNVTELFGARIRELRKSQGLTQDQLSDFLGIDQKHVSLIELGKSYPSLDRLTRIAEALKVSLPSLFEFDHLGNEGDITERIEKMLQELGERDQQKVFRIVKVFREG
jgi:transcriptional regulator with XRE-family HTH domain